MPSDFLPTRSCQNLKELDGFDGHADFTIYIRAEARIPDSPQPAGHVATILCGPFVDSESSSVAPSRCGNINLHRNFRICRCSDPIHFEHSWTANTRELWRPVPSRSLNRISSNHPLLAGQSLPPERRPVIPSLTLSKDLNPLKLSQIGADGSSEGGRIVPDTFVKWEDPISPPAPSQQIVAGR